MNKNDMPDVDSVKVDVRVYPLKEQKGATLAYASVNIDNIFAVTGMRVTTNGDKNFVSMPQSRDEKGNYNDICFPVMKGLRQKINDAVLEQYEAIKEQERPSVASQLKVGAKKAQEMSQNEKEKSVTKAGKER